MFLFKIICCKINYFCRYMKTYNFFLINVCFGLFSGFQNSMYALLTVSYFNIYIKFFVDVLCYMLGGINGTVLSAGTAEAYH